MQRATRFLHLSASPGGDNLSHLAGHRCQLFRSCDDSAIDGEIVEIAPAYLRASVYQVGEMAGSDHPAEKGLREPDIFAGLFHGEELRLLLDCRREESA